MQGNGVKSPHIFVYGFHNPNQVFQETVLACRPFYHYRLQLSCWKEMTNKCSGKWVFYSEYYNYDIQPEDYAVRIEIIEVGEK
jgi:hypothetical protein